MRETNRIAASLIVVMLFYATTQTADAVILDQSQNFHDGTFPTDADLNAAGYFFTAGGGLDSGQPGNDPSGTDGTNDGGIFVDGEFVGDSVTFPFAGSIIGGDTYNFGVHLFQSSTSFVNVDVELLAGATVVASISQGGINGRDDTPEIPATYVPLSYTADATMAGQALSFRATQTRGSNLSMDLGIDNWSLSVAGGASLPIANQSETFSAGQLPFGYTFSEIPNGYIANDPATPIDGATDGAIFVNGNDNSTISFVEHQFSGSMEDGQQYNFSTYLYQASTSFAESQIQLVADMGGANEAIVASTFLSGISGNSGSPTAPDFNFAELSYTGTAATDGQRLGLRMSSARGVGVSSDLGIDSWALTLSTGINGDFDNNSDYDCADIDALVTEIVAGTNNSSFDLTGDGSVDIADRDAWLAEAGAVELGSGNAYIASDLNLDGNVDSTDLGLVLNNFGATSGVSYCGGDINADSNVNSTDLGLLLNQFGNSAALAAAVPEPESCVLLPFIALALLLVRRKNTLWK